MKNYFVSRGFLPQSMGCVTEHRASDVSRRLSFYYSDNNMSKPPLLRKSDKSVMISAITIFMTSWCPTEHGGLPRKRESRIGLDAGSKPPPNRSGVRHDIRYLMAGEMIDPERCAQRRAAACPLHPVVRSFFSHNALQESRLRQFALSGTSDNEGVR